MDLVGNLTINQEETKMTQRQEFYLKEVLGFEVNVNDKSYIKSDFVRNEKSDYVRIMTLHFDGVKCVEKSIKYLRSSDDADPTPVDPFVLDEVKKNDQYILITIAKTVECDFLINK